MLTAIIQHTPTWVFILFCALLYLGLTRTQARTVKARRLMLMPIVISAWSLYSIYQAFATGDPAAADAWVLPAALLAWLTGAAVVLALLIVRGPRRDVVYMPDTQIFQIPGSWLPLIWLMTIFCAKFVIAACLAAQPDLHASVNFGLLVGLLYGALSGNLAGCAWRIVQVQVAHQARQNAVTAGQV